MIDRGYNESRATLIKMQEDASTTTDDDDSLLAELERKAAEVEAQLQQKEEENAELKRRIESYHVEWFRCEIRIKSLEEACHEQMAALQVRTSCIFCVFSVNHISGVNARLPISSLTRVMFSQAVQDAASKARPDEMSCDRRESLESIMKTSEEPSAARRRASRRSSNAVSRLGSEFRRQNQALDHGAAAFVEPARPWQPGVPSANSVDELRKLKAQFTAWKKDYKARLRKAKTEIIDKERRRRGGCWI
jgi:hypothetical protein